MDKSQRQALEAKFPDELVKKRRGSFGKPINYVEGGTVIARLNDALEGEWSFAIVEHLVLETGEVLVHGRLSALGIVKDAFGKSSPAISRETGEVLSMGDAFKAAATDALKKCATLLGVAAYLYSDDVPDATEDRPASAKPDKSSGPSSAMPRDRLSQKQLSTIPPRRLQRQAASRGEFRARQDDPRRHRQGTRFSLCRWHRLRPAAAKSR